MAEKNISRGQKRSEEVYRRKLLSEQQWSTIRFLWESGQYTFRILSEQFGISEVAIKKRSQKGQWKKGALVPDIDKRVKETTVEMLAKAGMTQQTLIDLMVKGAFETQCLKNVKRVYKDDSGKIVMQGSKPLIIEQSITVIDNETTLKYREAIIKLAGWNAAPKSPTEEKEDEKNEIPVLSSLEKKPLPQGIETEVMSEE